MFKKNLNVDIVIDSSRGDSGKGCVSHALLNQNKYDIVLRLSSGQNAGHTIYHNSRKFTTNIVPAGVFRGVRSIIGRNCAVHPMSFIKELDRLQKEFLQDPSLENFNLHKLVKIDGRACIVTDKHIEEDSRDIKIGTTRQGIGPAVTAKYGRIGSQAKDISELKPYIIDLVEEVWGKDLNILGEGAQGHYLDPNFGDVPYVTSMHCGTSAVLLNGLPHTSLRNVYLVAKPYQTYSGKKIFQLSNSPELEKIQECGQEWGVVTGRKRQCNFLNLNELSKAIWINGGNKLIINKMDILQQVDCWKIISDDGAIENLHTEDKFKERILDMVRNLPGPEVETIFSYSPERI